MAKRKGAKRKSTREKGTPWPVATGTEKSKQVAFPMSSNFKHQEADKSNPSLPLQGKIIPPLQTISSALYDVGLLYLLPRQRTKSSSHSRGTGRVWHEGRGTHDNLIIIDEDPDNSVGATFDVVECSPKRFKCSPQSRNALQGITRIDKDDGNHNSLRNGDEGGDLNVNATSGKKSHPIVNQSNNFDALGELQCQMHPCNGPSRNRFGLYTDYECNSSETDVSDCLSNEDAIAEGENDLEEAALRRKVLEDIHNSSCEILEHWEDAALRKKVLEDIHNGHCGLDDHNSAFELDTDYVRKEISMRKKAEDVHNYKCVPDNHGRASKVDADHVNPSNKYAQNKIRARNNKNSTECCMADHSPGNNTIHSGYDNPSSEKAGNASFSPASKYEEEDQAAGCCATVDHVIKNSTSHLNSEDVHLEKCGAQCEIQYSKEAVYGEASLRHSQLLAEVMPNNGGSFRLEEKEGLKESSLCSIGPQDERSICCLMNCSGNMGDMSLVQNSLLIGREKHKETDEYKHALEVEWESRQRQLEIQAKEAQLLRKRKKAEKLRLLDTERRQKRRLEEMRQSLKKVDEETMTLKQKLRVDFKRKLDKLESQYQDMASLLRGLGIHVSGGCHPESCQTGTLVVECGGK
ncbi:hypothetical protein ACLOJK_035670 [Asimina triloba]